MSGALSERVRAQHGFTLIEVLVSALLVLIISAGVATALVSATDFTGHERNSSQANAVAQQDQERMKAMTDSQLTSLHQTRTVSLNNTQFTVVSTASFIDANGGSSCVSGASAYFKISSTVTSPATAGNPGQAVTAETIITRPLAGTLVVPVQNEMSNPLSGAAVSVVGQSTGYTASATTDQNGCVAFAGLPTDGYAIAATYAGYVNPDGQSSDTETASVNQTNVTSAGTLILGSAGQLSVNFETRGTSVIYDGQTSLSGHGAAPVGYELSYYGSGNGNNMTNPACLYFTGSAASCSGSGTPTTFSASTAVSSFTVGNLFPFYINPTTNYANNYQLWAGSCEQEQPLVPLTGSGAASVTPGKLAASPGPDVYVDEPAIDVAVKSGTNWVTPTHVTIKFSGMNPGNTAVNCVDNWHNVARVATETPTGYSGTYGIYPAPFASQVATGQAGASNTGDQGSITVCADNGTKSVWSSAFTTSGNLSSPYVLQLTPSTSSLCP